MKTFLSTLLSLLVIIALSSCGSKKSHYEDESGGKDWATSEMTDLIVEEAPAADDYYYETESAKSSNRTGSSSYQQEVMDGETISLDGTPQAEVPKKDPAKIIKTAEISFQVDKYDESIVQLKTILKGSGAYISSEGEYNSDTEITNTLVIRIENEKFDLLVEEIMKLSSSTDYKNISAQDVTEAYVDLQTRLETKKKVEARYEAILLKANTIYDILQVEQELAYIREEIEAVEGKLKFYDDQVSYSTINLTMYEVLDYVPSSPDQSFGSKVSKALVTGWRGLLSFFIGISYLWPFWLLVIIGLWFLRRMIRRRRRRKAKA